MDVFLTVLLILAALILLYVLWCLAEPFFLVNDKISMTRSELSGGDISKATVTKLPFIPQGSESAPDLRFFFFSDIHTEWCPVTAKRLNKAIRKAHEAGGLDAVIFGGDIITYPENAAKGYKYLNEVSAASWRMLPGSQASLLLIQRPLSSHLEKAMPRLISPAFPIQASSNASGRKSLSAAANIPLSWPLMTRMHSFT